LNESSFLLAAIPNSCCVTANKLKEMSLPAVETTMDTVGKVLSWSFNAWFDGTHPSKNAWGQPLDEKRASLAGKRICGNDLRCIIWCAPADCEHNSIEYGLPNHNSNSPCMRCRWFLIGLTAMTSCIAVILDLVVQLLQMSSMTIFFKELHGKKGEKMQQLLQLVHDGYDAVGIKEGKISKLSLSHFCDHDAPHQNYPNLLHSAVKAKQTANLVPVCKHLCHKYLDGSDYAKWRLKCLTHLCQLQQIRSEGGLFLTGDQVALYQKSATKFLQYYNMLSKYSYELQDRIGQCLG